MLSGTPAVCDAIPSDYVINIGRVLYIYIYTHGLLRLPSLYCIIPNLHICIYIFEKNIGCHFNSWNVWAGWESIDNLLSCGYGVVSKLFRMVHSTPFHPRFYKIHGFIQFPFDGHK